jgi:glycosyltransferase involved in cell wall biosynthesis
VRIGIFPVGAGSVGGIHQVGMTMLRALAALPSGDEIAVLTGSGESAPAKQARELGVSTLTLPPARNLPQRALDRGRLALGQRPGVRSNLDRTGRRPRLTKMLRAERVELMVYPWPTAVSFEAGIPYVLAVHDLQHRLQPEFPEVSANGEWERREYVFRNGIRNAAVVVAESATGKEDILSLYGDTGIAPDRVKVLPYLPATAPGPVSADERRRVRDEHGLAARYLFYPAQFWPHKNHVNVVETLALLPADVELVLSGSHEGTLREETFAAVIGTARRRGLEARVRYIGYAPDSDMPALYAEAAALVMPTFFGPTNIPILEAWAVGCPVVTSDIRGVRDQAGDAAVLVDPRSPESIADGVRRTLEDEGLRAALAERGRRRIEAYTFEDYCRGLTDIVESAKEWIPSST